MKTITFPLIGCSLALLLSGCQAGPAVAPRLNVDAQELRTFPAEDTRLVNNKLFVWRIGMTDDDVVAASRISRRIDDLDDAAFSINREQSQILDGRGIDRLLKLEQELSDIQPDLDGKKNDLATEMAKPKPNQARINKLNARIKELEKKKAADETERDSEALTHDPDGKFRGRYRDNQAKLDANEVDGRTQVDRIMTIVDWYKDQPTSVAFVFQPGGEIQASISGWNLNDDLGAQNFSTETGTIRNVHYQPLGGVFTFDVLAYADPDTQRTLREVYKFRIARAKYEITDKDGRIFFAGEITRERERGYCVGKFAGDELADCLLVRRGLAKLVDRNN